MANAIEDALNRASAKDKQTIEAAKSHISSIENVDKGAASKTEKTNSVEEALGRTSDKDKQTIEAGKSHISSIENADKVSPSNAPSNTPANPKDLDKMQLNPETKSNIESVQQGQGNNYMYQNAVDRAQARPPQEPQKAQPQQDKER